MPLPRLEAVLFDLDGTLLDTLADIARAMNRVLVAHGYGERPVDDYRPRVGFGLAELVRRLLPDLAEERVGVLAREMSEEYRRNPVVSTAPYPGMQELVRELAAAGLPMAILSNKEDRLVQQIVARTLPPVFAVVQGQRDGEPRKPDPTSTRSILASIGARADRTAFVGDTEVDMQTALNAGCIPIGVAWGFRAPEAVCGAGAYRMCETPGVLAELICDATMTAPDREV